LTIIFALFVTKTGTKTICDSNEKNRMFLFNASEINVSCVLVTQRGSHAADLWHLRYGHLNIKGFQLLGNKNMIVGLPKISSLSFCGVYVYGKQSEPLFLVGKA